MKDFLKESGKYLYDISKIILGLGIITPLLKNEAISIYPIFMTLVVFGIGAILIYRGGKEK